MATLKRMESLKQMQVLPAAAGWKTDESTLVAGDIMVRTRNYGIIDKTTSDKHRTCVLTRDGDFVVYMGEKGFIVGLKGTRSIEMRSDKVMLKKRKQLATRCIVKLRFKFGSITLTLYGAQIERWRTAIYAVLEGRAHETIVETVAAPCATLERPVVEKVEVVLPPAADLTSQIDYTDNSPLQVPSEPSARSEVVPHSDLLSDADEDDDDDDDDVITTPHNMTYDEGELISDPHPSPVVAAVGPKYTVNAATFPPHRTANLGFILPHPPRNQPVYIPPVDAGVAAPAKPPRLSLSKIPVYLPSPTPRRSKAQLAEDSPTADRPATRISRAETFRSDAAAAACSDEDSTDSRMPYYHGRSRLVTPRGASLATAERKGSITSRASIVLTPRSDTASGAAVARRPTLTVESFEKPGAEEEAENGIAAHLEEPVRSYIQQCYAATLKDSKASVPRSSLMASKISLFETAAAAGAKDEPAARFHTMPRRSPSVRTASTAASVAPSTLPRSVTRSSASASGAARGRGPRASLFAIDFPETSV